MSTNEAVSSSPRFMADVVIVTIFGVLPLGLAGALGPMIQDDLAFGDALFGVATSAFFAVSGLVSVLAGRFVQRIGWQRGFLASLTGTAVACTGMAVLGRSWWLIAIWLGVAGLANSVSQTSSNLALSRVIRRGRQGVMFGLKQSAAPAAIALAGVAVPVIAVRFGWRAAFVLVAVIIVLFWLRMTGYVRRDRQLPTSATRAAAGAVDMAILVPMAIGAGLASAPGNSLGAFLVLSLAGRGVDPVAAAYLLTAASIAGIASRIIVGWLADRRDSGRLIGVAGLMATGAVGYVLLSLPPTWPTMILGAIIGFAAGWSWNGLFAFVVVTITPQAPADATGVTNTGVFLGGLVGPLGFGVIAENFSYATAWQVAAVMSMAGAVMLYLLRAKIVARRAAAAEGGGLLPG